MLPQTVADLRLRNIRTIETAVWTIVEALAFDSASEMNLSILGVPVATAAFPSPSARRATRMSVLLRILDIIHQGLKEDVVITKRDIYYRDPTLFGSQGVVDRAVDALARNLGVSRASLNVTASAKGTAVGQFVWMRGTGERINGMTDSQGVSITTINEDDTLEIDDVAWVLVIEKDATFNAVASANLHCSPDLPAGIVMTGKGYPDLATRAFLRRLSVSHHPHARPPAIYGLVDNDPDGISILSTYKHGSAALRHESETLRVPRLQWLGVRAADVLGSCYPRSGAGSGFSNAEDGRGELLRMSARDRAKACSMLQSSPLKEGGQEPEWRRELQVLLMLNVKAEIQALETRDGGVMAWLRERLRQMSAQQHA